MSILRERAQILNIDLNQPGFARPAEDPVVERAGKEFRKDGDEVKAHA